MLFFACMQNKSAAGYSSCGRHLWHLLISESLLCRACPAAVRPAHSFPLASHSYTAFMRAQARHVFTYVTLNVNGSEPPCLDGCHLGSHLGLPRQRASAPVGNALATNSAFQLTLKAMNSSTSQPIVLQNPYRSAGAAGSQHNRK